MRFSDLKGVALMAVTSIATLWLGMTGKLNLYIHPRYITFAMVAAALALIFSVFGAKYGHSDTPEDQAITPGRMAVIAACCFGVIALIAARPAALTSATAGQRGMNSAAVTNVPVLAQESPLFGSADYSNLTVKDWAGLLSSTDDQEFFNGKNVDITGFITADPRDPNNIFYISRFVVTCCAVDARPVGVPVYKPGWNKELRVDQWVHVTGTFAVNDGTSGMTASVSVKTIEQVNQPKQAYEY